MLAVVVIWAILSGQTLTVYAIADEPFTGWHVAVDSDQRVVECELMPIDGFSHWASLSWDKAGPGIEYHRERPAWGGELFTFEYRRRPGFVAMGEDEQRVYFGDAQLPVLLLGVTVKR